MPELTINGATVDIEEGASVLAACRKAGVDVPTMCFMEGFEHFTSCMICIVMEERSGRLIPSCSAPAEDGMAIDTVGEKVRAARKDALELLLREHIGDCEAPCTRVCPSAIDIPGMIRAIASGRAQQAAKIAGTCIALAGENCPARCEKACRRGRVDSPVSICMLVKFAFNEGTTGDTASKRFDSHMGGLREGELDQFMKDSSDIARIEPAGDNGFDSHEAVREAQRCMHCDCRKKTACVLRDLVDEYGADQWKYSGGAQRRAIERLLEHSEIAYEPGKCIKCGRCVRISRKAGEDPGLTFLGKGYDVRVGVPFGDAMSKALPKTAAKCARACPTGAIAMKGEREI